MKNFKDYTKYSDLENYLFGEVSNNFNKTKSFTPFELFAIAIFKANRNKGKIKSGIKNNESSVKKISNIVSGINLNSIESKKDAVSKLIELPGIGIPMSSAILSVAYPNDFTIVDYRTIIGLKDFYNINFDKKPSEDVDKYIEYIDKCKKKSDEENISLRELDKALWGYSFNKDLKEYVVGLT